MPLPELFMITQKIVISEVPASRQGGRPLVISDDRQGDTAERGLVARLGAQLGRGFLLRGGAVAGDVLQGQPEGGGQGRHGEERGGGDPASLDFAQGFGGDAGGGGDLGHAPLTACLAQQLAEALPACVLGWAEWRPDHGVIIIPV